MVLRGSSLTRSCPGLSLCNSNSFSIFPLWSILANKHTGMICFENFRYPYIVDNDVIIIYFV